MIRPIDYVVISDIHLGHRRNSTPEILANLTTYIQSFNPLEFDILFIAGDMFERLLDLSTPDIPEILIWMTWLIRYCSTHDIRIRVLEGTPSHDWGQARLFETTLAISQYPIDFKYIPVLHIEVMTDLGLTVLYVPDEWSPDPAVTFRQVQTLLQEHHLLSVDIAIMHGQFGYQLKKAINAPKHDESDYLSVVKHYIHIGHIHTHSVYTRIIAEGSFDRLAHGEEEPKGGVYVHLRPDRDSEYFFIPNRGAKIFKTLRIKQQTDLSLAIQELESKLSKIPRGSYVRLRGRRYHPLLQSIDDIRKRYIDYHFSKLVDDDVVEDRVSVVDYNVPKVYDGLSITKDNIAILLKREVEAKYRLTDRERTLYAHHTKDL